MKYANSNRKPKQVLMRFLHSALQQLDENDAILNNLHPFAVLSNW